MFTIRQIVLSNDYSLQKNKSYTLPLPKENNISIYKYGIDFGNDEISKRFDQVERKELTSHHRVSLYVTIKAFQSLFIFYEFPVDPVSEKIIMYCPTVDIWDVLKDNFKQLKKWKNNNWCYENTKKTIEDKKYWATIFTYVTLFPNIIFILESPSKHPVEDDWETLLFATCK